MKIDTKPVKDAVRVELVSGKEVKFAEKNGVSILRIGVASDTKLPLRKAITLIRKVVTTAKSHSITIISLSFKNIREHVSADVSDALLAEHVGSALVMANFEFTKFKTPPKEGFSSIKHAYIGETNAETKRMLLRGVLIGEEVNACRALSNTPGGDMTPSILAQAAKNAVKGTKVLVRALGKKEMQKLGMGAVLGIAKGSPLEPKFIIMEYKGGKANEKPLVLVGKGVTFDTGGLNLKPGDSMLEMHMDMSGAAAVIHAVALAAKLKVKRNIIGLAPAVENMLGGESVRPGDVLRSLSGKTIEILNTDAEGRVILADALTYAKRYNPSLVIEASTLTGASLVALGQHASAILSKDTDTTEKIRALGETSGDYVWPLPMWDEYQDMVKGNFADVSNIPAQGNTRYAGVIGGGMFLQQFAEGYTFVHLDIAPRMTAAPGEHLAKGAAGAPVRLFLSIAENL